MKRIPFSGGTAPKGYQFSSERNVNWWPYDQNKLMMTPGLKSFAQTGNGPLRAAEHHKDYLLILSGGTLYALWSTGRVEAVGSVGKTSGPARIISNGVNAMVLDSDGEGYFYDNATTSLITDPDFRALKATSLVFHDSYGIANKAGTGEWYISGSYNFTGWAALDFATAETKPDDLIEIVSDKNLLWLFGERTLEVWQNTGNADFPFEPLRSAFSHYGGYPRTIQRLDNNLYWLGKNEHGGKSVLRLAGGADPEQVSSDEINEWLDSLSQDDIDVVESMSMWWRGRPWYILTFPQVDTWGRTLVFDTKGGWFEWSTLCDSPDRHGRFRGTFVKFLDNKYLVGDSISGAIFELDGGTYTDGGLDIKRTRRLDTMGRDMEYVTWSGFQVEMETGSGTPGTDYTMSMRYSDDRGRSWSHARTKSIGEGGEYSKRVIWRRLGRSRRRTWELNTTVAKDIRINGGYIEATS